MTHNPVTSAYKTVGDCQIKADIYRPTTAHPSGAALVYIHGGCLMYGSRQNINPRQLGLYLQAGYTVVSIDYRLAPETKLPGIISDLQDAFRWVGELAPRVAVVGHSAGGYLALMAGVCAQPRPRAIVSFYGYGDIVGDWYSKPDAFYCREPRVSEEESERHVPGPETSELYEGRGKGKLYLYCRQNGLWPQEVGGHDPVAEPAFFVPYCPVHNVTGTYPPTLLLHGDCDTDVPYEQSVLMARELERQGVEHEFISMPGRGHGFDGALDDGPVKEAFNKVLAFLEEHLGS
jgi:acetyl esterase/lipase